MGYPYDVLRGDGTQIFNPAQENLCPIGPKALIRPWQQVERVTKECFDKFQVDGTFGSNVTAILWRTIAGHRTCSYHMARALSAALVEAVGGTSGSEYEEFRTPLFELTTSLVDRGYSVAWRDEVDMALGYFIDAAATGGLRKYAYLCRETAKAVDNA